jgi:two-component system invasion response regulator UvrY
MRQARRARETEGPVRVLVVDDQETFRKIGCDVVAATPGFALAGVADSGESALREVVAVRPDVVLMDVRMPGIGGVEAARRIAESHPNTVVVLLSTYLRDELSADGLCSAVVGKESLSSTLLRSAWEGAISAS